MHLASLSYFRMKISFHSYANKTNFHMKSFALSLAFVLWLKASRNWPIVVGYTKKKESDSRMKQNFHCTLYLTPKIQITNNAWKIMQ